MRVRARLTSIQVSLSRPELAEPLALIPIAEAVPALPTEMVGPTMLNRSGWLSLMFVVELLPTTVARLMAPAPWFVIEKAPRVMYVASASLLNVISVESRPTAPPFRLRSFPFEIGRVHWPLLTTSVAQ